MFKSIFIIGLTILSVGTFKVVCEEPKSDFSFENFFKVTQERLHEWEKAFLDSIGASSPDDAKKIVQKHGETLAKHFDVLANNIKQDTEDLQNLSTVKELRETLEKTVEDFKNKHPETVANVEEFIEKTKKDAENVISKIKSLNESPESENIKHLSQKLIESAEDAFKEFVQSVKQKAIKEN